MSIIWTPNILKWYISLSISSWSPYEWDTQPGQLISRIVALYIINFCQINSGITIWVLTSSKLSDSPQRADTVAIPLLLPRQLIFALFSSLIEFVSFSTNTHTHKKNYGCFIFKATWEAVSFSFSMLISGLRQCVSCNVPDQIQDHSDHGTSKGPLYPIWTSIHRVAAVPLMRLGQRLLNLVRYFKKRTLKALHTNSLGNEIYHSWHSVHIDPTFPSFKPLRIWIMQYTIKRLSWFVF